MTNDKRRKIDEPGGHSERFFGQADTDGWAEKTYSCRLMSLKGQYGSEVMTDAR